MQKQLEDATTKNDAFESWNESLVKQKENINGITSELNDFENSRKQKAKEVRAEKEKYE